MTSKPFNITAHARGRWQERFDLPLDEMAARLERTGSIGRGLRKHLMEATKSDRHRAMLQQGSGYFYRRSRDAIFVLSNLDVVTVFKLPEQFSAKRKIKYPPAAG